MSVIETKPDLRLRRAVPQDASMIGDILARAFHDDPVGRWVMPGEERRRRIAPRVFRLFAEAYIPHEDVYVNADGTGVALWLPPDRQLLDDEQAEVFGARLGEAAGIDASRLFELQKLFDDHLPRDSHYHLHLLGVVPERQGRGIGSALLDPLLERADSEGVPAYLEATSPRNEQLYERHGFAPGDMIAPPGGPPLCRMWREPH
jgi:ribosomal protein S18 acetylase RimI-like enzyme